MDRVVDVYGGSGAFCLTLAYQPSHLVYNDRHQEAYTLFVVLRDPVLRPQLCAAVALTPWSRTEYLSCRAPTTPTTDPVERARRFLVRSWQGQKGDQSGRTGWRNKGSKHGRAGTYEVWTQLPDRLAVVAERLRHAELECLPALTIIGRYATPETLLYCDPPYIRTTVHGTRRALYQHEMTDADHHDLLDALDAHPGPVMLSGYQNDVYAARLPHWHMVSTAARGESNARRMECLWLNAACVAQDTQQLRLELRECHPV
jgi:DNA adenine methylase